jgi:hypothetical protein
MDVTLEAGLVGGEAFMRLIALNVDTGRLSGPLAGTLVGGDEETICASSVTPGINGLSRYT